MCLFSLRAIPKLDLNTKFFSSIINYIKYIKTSLYNQIVDSDEKELKLRFLTEAGSNSIYTWPATEDASWLPRTDVGRILSQPELAAGRGIRLKFIDNELKLCKNCVA